MNPWTRFKNLWKLSEFESGQATDEYKTPGTQIAMIVKKPASKAQFFPRNKIAPIDQITKVAEEGI